MKRIFIALITFLLLGSFWLAPGTALAAGIGASGGTTTTVGNSFTVNVVASGATFDAFHGVISVSGPVSIVSFSAGNAIWANSPANNKAFDGALSTPTTSFTIASIRLKGTAVGSGTVSVSSVMLVRNGVTVGSTGGSTKFTINRAPTVPGAVTVTSSTNPDPTQAYGVTTVQLAWTAPTNGATGYAIAFDQVAGTVPPATVNTTALSASYPNLNLGTYYFHIMAKNADGWGPVTHFTVNISRSTDTALAAPKITTVLRDTDFANDVVAGTVKNFTISGTSTNLTGYTVALSITPSAAIPTAQLLTGPINADGTWSVVFDQAIPVGFYKVTAAATLDKVTTPSSDPVSIELAVENGGNVKIITTDDLPKPDLTVKVAGITFADRRHFDWAIGAVVGFAILFTLLAYFARQLYKRLRKIRSNKKDEPRKLDTPKPDLPKPPVKRVM